MIAGMGERLVISAPQYGPMLARLGLRSYSDFADCDVGSVVSKSGSTLTRRIEVPDADAAATDGMCTQRGGITLYLKQYRHDGPRSRHRFRQAKCGVEVRNYRLLRERCCVNVPEVVAYGARRRGWRLVDAFILTRGIDDAVPLDAWWAQRYRAGSVPNGVIREILDRGRAMVARMHRAGFFHIDLQWRNVLIREAAEGVELFVLDSSRGGMRYSPWMTRHARLRDLSSLEKSAREHLSLRHRMRWLRSYLADVPCRGSSRDWARRIAEDRVRKDGESPA